MRLITRTAQVLLHVIGRGFLASGCAFGMPMYLRAVWQSKQPARDAYPP